ncbi:MULTISPECIES: non-ribosomal peptide synthetase [unclassified Streptomyces]|uniref:non-ribosomal peptide synthetase n=1 Tax=unclassified Streptomyces TaxID=2593676 RepID=UPI002E18DB9B|nr:MULTISPECIES: non-ribosomal peptide synthetase [unclassified Streptomyces]
METWPADRPRCLDTMLLERWDRTPSLPALVDGDVVVSMGELKERVLRVAGALLEQGLRPGERVVVYQERSIEFVVSLLGVIVARGATAAFDVGDPLQRTLQMVEDCTPRLLITTDALAERLGSDLTVPVLTAEACCRHDPADLSAPTVRDPEQPAVIIYTSGSTGKPKASLISHRALISRLDALQSTHRMDEADSIIHHTVCSFDMYLIEVYWPLVAGARVVIAEPGRHRDADYLADLIKVHGITTFYCVVSLLDLFLLARDPAERYDGIRQVLTGGEPLSPDLVKRLYARSTATLTNLYGPSECTIYCTAWECPRDPELDTVLIGPAIDDTLLRILDEDGGPVDAGEPGELYIGGAGLALGYLNRPELTAERFVQDPYGKPGERLYRSGDLVREQPHGVLEYLGRVDRQVKIRGIRIEPGGIEAVAVQCPGVQQAAVVTQGEGSAKRLVAFVVQEPDTDEQTTEAALRDWLRAQLPYYMVPSALWTVDRFPLTANGKLDQSALGEWADKLQSDQPSATAPPVTDGADLETAVADIWRAVLGTSTVDLDEDFFDIGGDSFKVVQVIEAVRDLLQREIPMSTLLHEPTLAAFTAQLRHTINQERRA